jgi:hypothetical protein
LSPQNVRLQFSSTAVLPPVFCTSSVQVPVESSPQNALSVMAVPVRSSPPVRSVPFTSPASSISTDCVPSGEISTSLVSAASRLVSVIVTCTCWMRTSCVTASVLSAVALPATVTECLCATVGVTRLALVDCSVQARARFIATLASITPNPRSSE